jgi:hypothetical protein
MHLVSMLAWEGFGQYMLRWILCARWQGMVSSTLVEMHFVSPLAWDVSGQHRLRYIFVLAGMEWVWSTHAETLFVFSVAVLSDIEGFGQHD